MHIVSAGVHETVALRTERQDLSPPVPAEQSISALGATHFPPRSSASRIPRTPVSSSSFGSDAHFLQQALDVCRRLIFFIPRFRTAMQMTAHTDHPLPVPSAILLLISSCVISFVIPFLCRSFSSAAIPSLPPLPRAIRYSHSPVSPILLPYSRNTATVSKVYYKKRRINTADFRHGARIAVVRTTKPQ